MLKANFISKTREATPTKIGLHAFDITLYTCMSRFFFLTHMPVMAFLQGRKGSTGDKKFTAVLWNIQS